MENSNIDAPSTELTEREMQVMRLLTQGKSNQEIAADLHISPHTVKVHIRNIYSKIGVQSRIEATRYAVQQGWVTIRPVAAPTEAMGVAPSEAVEAYPAEIPGVQPVDAEPTIAVGPPSLSGQLQRIVRPFILVSAVLMALVLAVVLNRNQPGAENAPATPFPQSRLAVSEPKTEPVTRWAVRPGNAEVLRNMSLVAEGGRIYTVGGLEKDQVTGKVGIFDPASNSWSAGTAKPTPVFRAGAGVIGGRIYVAGGCTQEGKPVPALEVYTPDQSSPQTGGQWETRAPIPGGARCGLAAVALEGKLYIFGGYDGRKYTSEVWVYDPEADRWSPRTPMATPKGDMAAVATESAVYLLGGTDGKTLLDDVDIYQPAQEGSKSSPWAKRNNLPDKRSNMGAAMLGGRIFVVGGEGNQNNLPALEYDVRSNAWNRLEDPPQIIQGPTSAVALDTKLYVLGNLLGNSRSVLLEYTALYRIIFPGAINPRP
ncbi:MAG: helix-turn-helix domain-containing protein [Chloroflexi bacterium]|nr:helix-turn-helix domain-containing protein [Chloroflexota bacterium]